MKRRASRERQRYKSLGLKYVHQLNHRKVQVTAQRLRWWRKAVEDFVNATSDKERLLAATKIGERSLAMGLPLAPIRPRGRSLRMYTVTTFTEAGCVEEVIEFPRQLALAEQAIRDLHEALKLASVYGPASG